MANYIGEAAEGDSVLLTFNNILKNGTITVTAKVYDVDDTQVGSNITLSHVADGLYTFKYTVPSPGTSGDLLTIIYIPSGDDNSTSTDQLKVRLTSPWGGGARAGAMADGINDDDIKALIKAFKKSLPTIEEIDLEPLNKKLDRLLDKPDFQLTDLTSIDRSIDIKMTEVKGVLDKLIPVIKVISSLNTKVDKIDLRNLNSLSQIIKTLTKETKDIPRAIILMQNEIKDARDKLLDIKSPTEIEMKSLKELMFKADELQKKRFEVIILSMLSLLQQITTELKNNNGNFGKTLKEVEALKQTLAIFNLNTLQNEIL